MRKKLIEVLKYCASPEADCTKCERWSLDIESKCVEDLLLSAAIALEEKQATSDENKRWIPVSERLPEKEGTYIVRTTTGAVTTARFYEEWDMTNCRGDFIKHVEAKFHRNATHWMPLPEPPAIDK